MKELEEPIKQKIIAVIHALMPDAKIYLFGSRARGTARDSSDIDLALDRGTKIPFYEIAEIKNVIEALSIPYLVDVLDMNSISDEMRTIILKEAILWKA
jgi:predicted nucleotidyltransferase